MTFLTCISKPFTLKGNVAYHVFGTLLSGVNTISGTASLYVTSVKDFFISIEHYDAPPKKM